MLQTVKIIIAILPYLMELLKIVEAQINENGKGAEKLVYVREVLCSLYPEVVSIWGSVEKVVSATVSLYNATGVFKKD